MTAYDWRRMNQYVYEVLLRSPGEWRDYHLIAGISTATKDWHLYINNEHMTAAPTFEAIEDMVPIMLNLYKQRTTR